MTAATAGSAPSAAADGAEHERRPRKTLRDTFFGIAQLGIAAVQLDDSAVDAETAPDTAAQRPAFVVGEAVKVKRCGRGTVVAADADTATVGFDGGSERCFQAGRVRRV